MSAAAILSGSLPGLSQGDSLAASLFPEVIEAQLQDIESSEGLTVCAAKLSVPAGPELRQLMIRGDGPLPAAISVTVAGEPATCGLASLAGGWLSLIHLSPPAHFWIPVEIQMQVADADARDKIWIHTRRGVGDLVSMTTATVVPCGAALVDMVESDVSASATSIRAILEAGDVATALDAYIEAAADPHFLHSTTELGQDLLSAAAADADVRIETKALILLAVLSS